ncbi:MAG: hypothetical protein ACUVV5_05195 [Candidatus Aminicenantales bacterium]
MEAINRRSFILEILNATLSTRSGGGPVGFSVGGTDRTASLGIWGQGAASGSLRTRPYG